jgi:hypothetical protein
MSERYRNRRRRHKLRMTLICAIVNRKDAPKDLTDAAGRFSTDTLEKFLHRMKKSAEYVKKAAASKRAEAARAKVADESLEDFTKRFWEENGNWHDFVDLEEITENWARYFVRQALQFG